MPYRASSLFRHSLFVLRHLVPAELRRDIPHAVLIILKRDADCRSLRTVAQWRSCS